MNERAPAWMRFLAHLAILMKLWREKIVANVIIMAVLSGLMMWWKGGALPLPNGLAIIVGYSAAFMFNFYAQFGRYRETHRDLTSDRAATFEEISAALDREYHAMMKSGA